jgi:long-chain fatty acid transport protein
LKAAANPYANEAESSEGDGISRMHANFRSVCRRLISPSRIPFSAYVAAALVAQLIGGPPGSGRAYASGYALREQSASALGNAFAGATAGAEDLSYMYFNPAALTRQSETQVAPVVTAILPRLKMRDVRGGTAAGTPISGNNGGGNAAEENVVAALYGLLDLQDTFGLEQNVKFGIGVNVPFGVETDYRDGWIGRYHALHLKVLALNVNPALAWEITHGVSLAAGLQVQYIRARLTNAIDMGTIGASRGIPGSLPGAQDGRGKVSGDGVGYGFILGALWEPRTGTRIGAGYRSSVEHNLEGDANFELGGSAVARTLATRSGLFQDTGAKAHVVTPETVSLGIYQDLSPQWAVMGEAQWTRWSRFDDLTVKFDNPAQPDSVTDENWSDFVSRRRLHLEAGRCLDAARRRCLGSGPDTRPAPHAAHSHRRSLLDRPGRRVAAIRQSHARPRIHAHLLGRRSDQSRPQPARE